MATASQPPTRRLSRLALAVLCAAAAGCGGADDASDSDQIETAVKRVMESDSVEDQCEVGVSERFVREVYVTRAHCREANRPAAGDPPPDSAAISATRVAGDRATTRLTLTSVKGGRAAGRIALVKVGETWKVDRLGIDFLRSVFATLPTQADSAEQRRILGCLAQATRKLADAEVRRIGNLVVGRRLTEDALPPGAERCIRSAAATTQSANA